jgi:hypothetical protein
LACPVPAFLRQQSCATPAPLEVRFCCHFHVCKLRTDLRPLPLNLWKKGVDPFSFWKPPEICFCTSSLVQRWLHYCWGHWCFALSMQNMWICLRVLETSVCRVEQIVSMYCMYNLLCEPFITRLVSHGSEPFVETCNNNHSGSHAFFSCSIFHAGKNQLLIFWSLFVFCFVKHLTNFTNKQGYLHWHTRLILYLAFRSSGPKYPLQSTGNHSISFTHPKPG